MSAAGTSNDYLKSKKSSYMIICPMGFELVMQESIMAALSEFGFKNDSSIELLFERKGLENDDLLRDRVLRQRRKKQLKLEEPNAEFGAESLGPVVGPVNDGSEIFIGEYRKNLVAAKAGATEISIMLLQTVAPPVDVSRIRSIGAILALVTHKEEIFKECMSSEGVSETISALGREEALIIEYKDALRLWALHASLWNANYCTQTSNNLIEPHKLEMKISGKSGLSYRASCLRNQKKNKNLKSCDLFAAIGSTVPIDRLQGIPLAAEGSHSILNSNEKNIWRVDLKSYDFEVVGFVIDKHFALGISLLPYNCLNSTDFSRGSLPSDITPPIVGSGINNIIRLRPSTASLLLHIAQPHPGDILVDTCAGIGTIPVEAAIANKGVVGIGGEVVPDLEPIISLYNSETRRFGKSYKGSSNMILWDATLLPLRTGCADIIVCDLPFGQKCMNSNKLRQFCPLLIAEMARILRPSGRMVLLGGSLQNTLDALTSVGENVFRLPCTSIFPVNIGGLLAYVIEVGRSNGHPIIRENHREKIRRLTMRRSQLDRHGTFGEKADTVRNKKQRKLSRLQSG